MGKGAAVRVAPAWAAAVLLAFTGGGVAQAKNLDRETAIQVAKRAARKDCRQTSGCKDWNVRDLRRLSRHKALARIHVISTKNGQKYDCRRQVAIKLDHEDGDVAYALTARRCVNLGPA